MYATWEQAGGDVRASKYGAIFCHLDKCGDAVYGVYVVEVTDLIGACGEKSAVEMGGAYATSSSWVDVDNLPYRQIHDIVSSCGYYYPNGKPTEDTAMPTEVLERIEWIEQRITDLHRLAIWNARSTTEDEANETLALRRERADYELWYAMPRYQRAIEAHTYGGYSDTSWGCPGVFQTLREAMENYDIPVSALLDEHEYTAPDPLADVYEEYSL